MQKTHQSMVGFPARAGNNPREQLEQLTSCLFDPADLIELRHLPSRRSEFVRAGELPDSWKQVKAANDRGDNVFFGVNPRAGQGGRGGNAVALARTLVADLDYVSIDEATKRWREARLPDPTLIVSSGHGAHFYVRPHEPITDLRLWSTLQVRLSGAVESDPKIKDAARIMRLPGTLNHKEPVARAHVVRYAPGNVYGLDLLEQLLPHEAELGHIQGASTPCGRRSRQRRLGVCPERPTVELGSLPRGVLEAIRRTMPTGYRQRHCAIYEFVRRLKRIRQLDGSPQALDRYIAAWHAEAIGRDVIRTKVFQETWTDFNEAWARFEEEDERHLSQIVRQAETLVLPASVLARCPDGEHARLARLCAALQIHWGERPFFLAVRTAGKVLNVSKSTAGRYVAQLEQNGVIERLSVGSWDDRSASLWRFCW